MLTTQDVQGHTASLPDSQDVTTEPEVLPAPPHTNNQTLVTTIMFTFGIPAYHASLATIARDTMFGESTFSCMCNRFVTSCLDLKALVPVWKAVRHFDCVLLAYVVCHLADGYVKVADDSPSVIQRPCDSIV